jgi:thymidylate synthase
MVSAWNVGELDQMVLPPCHYGFQVYTRELSLEERLDLASKTYDVFDPLDFSIPAKVDHDEIDKLYPVPKRTISLMWNQRSVDTFLGLPFNIASYGLLLILIAREVNMIPENLIGNLGDTHLYLNHLEQAEDQISREPFELPNLEIIESNLSEGEFEFNLLGYQSHSQIKAPLSN